MRGRSTAFVAACGLSSVAAFSPTAPTTTHLRAAGTSIARATAIQLQDKAEVRRALASNKTPRRSSPPFSLSHRTILSHPQDELDGWGGSIDGGTMFAAWDGKGDEGIGPDGVLPPGDDLIEKDLRRLFDLESSDESLLAGTGEMDELKLMFKLRKELGDADFQAIFEDRKVKGPNIDLF